MFEGEDYSVLRDGHYIGRIYRTHDGRWLWAVSAFIEASQRNGLAESREAAMAAFKASVHMGRLAELVERGDPGDGAEIARLLGNTD